MAKRPDCISLQYNNPSAMEVVSHERVMAVLSAWMLSLRFDVQADDPTGVSGERDRKAPLTRADLISTKESPRPPDLARPGPCVSVCG